MVNRTNPLGNLTRKQLQDIYTPRLDHCKQLGGPDLAIKMVSRDRSSRSYQARHEIVLSQESIVTGLPLEHSSSTAIRPVSQSRGAIGYASLTY
jgi:phosphate transport system substrate-binding protein